MTDGAQMATAMIRSIDQGMDEAVMARIEARLARAEAFFQTMTRHFSEYPSP